MLQPWHCTAVDRTGSSHSAYSNSGSNFAVLSKLSDAAPTWPEQFLWPSLSAKWLYAVLSGAAAALCAAGAAGAALAESLAVMPFDWASMLVMDSGRLQNG